MSKTGHINKYITVVETISPKSISHPGNTNDPVDILYEVWRMDNKWVHLYRAYNYKTRKLEYPTKPMRLRVNQFNYAMSTCSNSDVKYTVHETKDDCMQEVFLYTL